MGEHGVTPLLEVGQVTKQFPGVLALRGVDLTLYRGEVLAVIGENGAGKSTLMKILAGVQPADSGEICIDGQPVQFQSVREALAHGVALIHQELNLADNLDVGANIFLGREPLRFGLIDHERVKRESREFLDAVGLEADSATLVKKLPVGKQQMVEIAKALSINARVLIMDEPTSSLSQRETENLFAVIKDLRTRGVSIVYISHRLGEVKELADRVYRAARWQKRWRPCARGNQSRRHGAADGRARPQRVLPAHPTRARSRRAKSHRSSHASAPEAHAEF